MEKEKAPAALTVTAHVCWAAREKEEKTDRSELERKRQIQEEIKGEMRQKI